MLTAYAIMRTAKVKSVASMANLEKHCSREKYPANANRELEYANREFYKDELTLPERFKEMTNGQTIRKNAVLGIEVMMTYSPDATPDLDIWVAKNSLWLDKEFGEGNVVRLWLHMDETTPHLHAFVIPMDERGKLNCKAFLGGSAKMSALQDSYAEAMQEFNLERGIKGSKAHHTTVKEFYRAIESRNKENLPSPRLKQEKARFGQIRAVEETATEYYSMANSKYKSERMRNVHLEHQSVQQQYEIKTLRNQCERQQATIDAQKPAVTMYNALNNAIKHMAETEPERAEKTRNDINGLLEEQYARQTQQLKPKQKQQDREYER